MENNWLIFDRSCSGVIAASINNSIGVSGLCPNCKIMCLRFISGMNGRVSDEIAAIDYALDKKVRISNNSYGGYGGVEAELKAIERAQQSHHLFVAAAGNENKDTDKKGNFHVPSSYPLDNILSVGAYNRQGEKSSFSNYGATSVDLLAPGSDIATTSKDGGYSFMSGTSFSAPVVAATVAMIWSRYPQLSYTSVIDSVVKTCNKGNSANKNASRCQGILDLLGSVKMAEHIAHYGSLLNNE